MFVWPFISSVLESHLLNNDAMTVILKHSNICFLNIKYSLFYISKHKALTYKTKHVFVILGVAWIDGSYSLLVWLRSELEEKEENEDVREDQNEEGEGEGGKVCFLIKLINNMNDWQCALYENTS